MKQKLTPWYPSRIKPVRRGLYERDIPTIGVRLSFWTGKYWGGFAMINECAFNNRTFRTGHPQARWRGIARKPK